MLVVTRKVKQRIFIGDDIVITLVEIEGGGKARIGVEAPANIRVDREEVREARKRTEAANAKT